LSIAFEESVRASTADSIEFLHNPTYLRDRAPYDAINMPGVLLPNHQAHQWLNIIRSGRIAA
ncbi:MAG TPA: hypothetical protein VHE60_05930, partial [Pyrinomonadaceae bacterium]|nr:hypothetical protein [Pyrinomonadaceae bacterium]